MERVLLTDMESAIPRLSLENVLIKWNCLTKMLGGLYAKMWILGLDAWAPNLRNRKLVYPATA
eukprot:10579758-Heterocapsa_arctica.AAC.1